MKYDIDSINKRKKNIEILKKLLSIFIIIFIYNIILIFISSENLSNGIGLFGYRAYIITSNSMEPSICLGDVVITKKCDEKDIHTGDVITFKQEQEVITHRILKIEKSDINEEFIYVTKGDNNNVEDTENINYSQIQGKSILTIPYLGKIILILDNKIIILIVILIFLILCFMKIQKQEKMESRREKKKIEQDKRNIKENC